MRNMFNNVCTLKITKAKITILRIQQYKMYYFEPDNKSDYNLCYINQVLNNLFRSKLQLYYYFV